MNNPNSHMLRELERATARAEMSPSRANMRAMHALMQRAEKRGLIKVKKSPLMDAAGVDSPMGESEPVSLPGTGTLQGEEIMRGSGRIS